MKRWLATVCVLLSLVLLVFIASGQHASAALGTYAGLGGGVVDALTWDGTNLYAGCYNGHVYRCDGGTNWTDIWYQGGMNGGGHVQCLASGGGNLYAGCEAGVWRYDGGVSWNSIGSIAGIINGLVWNAGKLYAGSNDGHVYRLEGASWTDTWTGGGSTSVWSLILRGANLYAGCGNGHVYRYDGGTTWSDVGAPGGEIVQTLAATGSDLYAGSAERVYRYAGGSTWTDAGDPSGLLYVNSLVWTGASLYAGCGDSVYRYAGGTTWTDVGLAGESVNAMAWNGTNLFAGGYSGRVFRYVSGTNWTNTWAAGGSSVNSFAFTGTDLYAGCDSGVYRYTGGTAWTDTGLSEGSVWPLLWNGANLYAGCGSHVYRYAGGTTWTDLGDTTGVVVYSLAWDGTNLFAGCRNDAFRYAGGTSWTDIGNGYSPILAMTMSGGSLYSGDYKGSVRRYDGGTTWTLVGTPGRVYSLLDNGAGLFAGVSGNSHVYRYAGGSSWSDLGLKSGTTAYSLTWNGNSLFAGCDDAHTYRYDGGTAWTDTGSTGGPVYATAWNGSSLFSGGPGGVYRSEGVNNHTITASVSGYFGDVSPYTQTVSDGSTAAIEISPSDTYRVGSITDNGVTVPGPYTNAYAIADIKANHDVVVSFTDSYDVTAGAPGGHGSVSPGLQSIQYGRAAAVGLHPDPGYATGSITDNGHRIAGPYADSYTIGNVTANHDVVVSFAAQPEARSSFYFAEGTTRDLFQEYLCIGNPNDTAATANVTYLFSDGTTKACDYTVAADSRYTVNVNEEVGPGRDVSIKVLSQTANLVAERPMYFDYAGKWTGGSDAVGAVGPSKAWYFAEGNTLPEFDQYVTVLNPGATPANLTFHYMVEGEGEKVVTGRVDATTRATFKTVDQIGANKNVSLYLESDEGVVAERPMYFDYRGLAGNDWTGGHDVVGTNSPNTDWYFAEGTTRKNSIDGSFETWLCLQNPQTIPIEVNATYQLAAGQGTPVKKTYTVPGLQRLTVSVNAEIGKEKDFSVHLSSASPFIAERPMYFDYHGKWTGGHDVLGANSSAGTWFFAEGTTRSGFEEWLCLQNSGSTDAHTTITYYPASGRTIQKNWTVRANSRLTVSANGDAGPNQDISARISSDAPVIVERPMYFDFGNWDGGHDVVGFVPAP